VSSMTSRLQNATRMPNTLLLRRRPKRASLLRRVVELLKRGVVRPET